MAWFANDSEEMRIGNEDRQQIVLDVARHPCLARAVAVDDHDLPIVARHHLKCDARAIGREGWRVDALGALSDK